MYTEAAPRKGVNTKVLVVDDKAENHRAFGRILDRVDTEVYNAMSGKEAIALSLRHNFSVILLDVMMPEMNGFETASLIRVNEDTQYIPIIFITAASKDDVFEFRGYEVGAVDYLFKPIKPITLENKVRVFVELDRKRSQLKLAMESLSKVKKRSQLILDSVGEGIVGLAKEGSVIFSNPAAHKLLSYSEQNLKSKRFTEMFELTGDKECRNSWKRSSIYQQCLKRERVQSVDAIALTATGQKVPVEIIATPIIDNESFVGVVIAFVDITERVKSRRNLEILARLDSLTGLENRNSFSTLLDRAVARCLRQSQPLGLLFIDLDKFKPVNDKLGHDAGDLLLKQVAKRLRSCVRSSDIVCRFGGDEFTIILESMDAEQDAAVVAKKIIKSLSEGFDINEARVNIGASIGIATYPKSASTSESLLRCADVAMYRAKENRDSEFCFFEKSLEKAFEQDLDLENRLKNALKARQFELYYQPKIDPYRNRLVGVEALIRWKLETGESMTPERFVKKAEETGLIVDIGRWTIDEACRIAKQWINQGLLKKGCSIAINLSVCQLQKSGLLETVERAVQRYDIAPYFLEFEITESVLMDDVESSVHILNHLHQLGVKLSIDDFGTGYSSLSYLRRLPIDGLKIDRSFIANIGESEHDYTIVNAIIALAHNLGLTVIAEGVESESQLRYLMRQCCDAIQGYHYSPPMTYEEATLYIQQYA